MNNIKIAIADDYKIFREGMAITLSHDDSFSVTIEASNGQELLDAMAKDVPDVVIMDYKMPVMDGIEATQTVKSLYPAVKVLVISMYEDQEFKDRLMKNGADGYLLKNAEPEMIRKAIHDLFRNN